MRGRFYLTFVIFTSRHLGRAFILAKLRNTIVKLLRGFSVKL
jgi:hypothetical protein